MPTDTKNDAVLVRFRTALHEQYGDEIDRVVLFGSRARGDARADSDYDVAIFLRSMSDKWKEQGRVADLRVDFIDSTGVFFDTKTFPAKAYHDQTPIMQDIRLDGREL